jgi:hypothetical protein
MIRQIDIKFDAMALRVDIAGRPVRGLPREEPPAERRKIAPLGRPVPSWVLRARVAGSWRRRGGNARPYGGCLDLDFGATHDVRYSPRLAAGALLVPRRVALAPDGNTECASFGFPSSTVPRGADSWLFTN